MGILKTIFIIFIVYYGFKFLSRLLFPFLMKKLINKVENNYYNQQNHTEDYDIEKGNVKVKFNKKNKTSHQPDEGEYVDFEEIE